VSTSDFRRIFPHLLSADDILGPGPSPWQLCLSCGLRYRTLAFVRRVAPPCPVCEASR